MGGKPNLPPILRLSHPQKSNRLLSTPGMPATTKEIPQKSRNGQERLDASAAVLLSKARTKLLPVQRQQLQFQAFHTLANVDLLSHMDNSSIGPNSPVAAVSKYLTLASRFVSSEATAPRSKNESGHNSENAPRGKPEHPDGGKLAQIYYSSDSHVTDSSHDDSGLKNDIILSHVDGDGKASMVGVAAKPDTLRAAEAEGRIIIGTTAAKLVAENGMKKGDVLSVAQLAGVMGAKATSSLIPLCHPLLITNITVNLTLDAEQAAVVVRTR